MSVDSLWCDFVVWHKVSEVFWWCLQPTVPGSAGSWSSVGKQATVLYSRAVLASVSLVGKHASEHPRAAGCAWLLSSVHRPSWWTDQGVLLLSSARDCILFILFCYKMYSRYRQKWLVICIQIAMGDFLAYGSLLADSKGCPVSWQPPGAGPHSFMLPAWTFTMALEHYMRKR